MTFAQVALRLMLRAAPFVFSCLFVIATATEAYFQKPAGASRSSVSSVPRGLLLRIVRAEDERRWDADLSGLLSDRNAAVRARAALAAGRIGDERAVPSLVALLQQDKDDDVRAMAAFALGETETAAAGDALVAELAKRGPARERARIVEALGKITAVLPATDETRVRAFRKEIYAALELEAVRRSAPNTEVILLGLTAALRARPEGVGKVIAEFLTFGVARIRADAANALARLRAKDGNEQLRELLVSDPDPIVRANAARVLGATEDKDAFDGLLDRALKDTDSRVRVSAIRALGTLKDQRAASALMERGERILLRYSGVSGDSNELLEIAVALGQALRGTSDKNAFSWLLKLNNSFLRMAPEPQIALVRISPTSFLAQLGDGGAGNKKAQEALLVKWKAASSLAQALGEIAALPDSTPNKQTVSDRAQEVLRALLDYKNSRLNINTLVAVHSEYAIPDVLRAFAVFKSKDQPGVLLRHLKDSDVIVRATAAELLGELPPVETNARALADAFRPASKDELNDAALAILDSLAKQKSYAANEAIKSALDSSDHLIRRRAVALLKANNAGDFSARIRTVQIRNTVSDYERAISRIGRNVHATVSTSRGSFTIGLLPGEAPLNVDSFIQLSKGGYFRGITFHRVVPNFVIQGGDPRGDGNGGPGYSIRCEINQVPYERGAVGMALSGKDTGGSQWFVTHSPQPHLDGGYTGFGRVVSGMEVVDAIMRGDVIRNIVITETGPGSKAVTRHRTPKERL
ncbi:MAG: peptidylprolyl isomerase [Pyrinomonadaceae bacterium]|nr:peptidylprolyl isomerase [Pyrinomonadaceae bacterium]